MSQKKLMPPFLATIPRNVLADKNLQSAAKLHYGYLVGLARNEGYCWATDQQLADMHEVSIKAVEKWHQSLA